MRQEEPGEPVVFFTSRGVLAFQYYYRGVNSLHGLPADIRLDEFPFDPALITITDEESVYERLRDIVPAGARFRLVFQPVNRDGQQVLESALETYTQRLAVHWFTGVAVIELELRAPP
jgi:hypothetical protein